MLNRDDHVRQHRRAAWAGDGEQVGETVNGETQIVHWASTPGIGKPLPAAATNISTQERARHRVKSSSQHDDVEFKFFSVGNQSIFCEAINFCQANVYKFHVVSVKCLVITRVDYQSLATDHGVRLQAYGNFFICNDRSDLVAHPLRNSLIGCPVDHCIVETSQK